MKIQRYKEFKKYCQILHPNGHNYFACYHTDGGAPIQKNDFQPSEQVYEELLEMNNEGYDIYTVVQPSTDFKDLDVTGNRFYIADWDAGRDDEGNYYNDKVVAKLKAAKLLQWQSDIAAGKMLEPTLIVETRNGFHLYWLLDNPKAVYWAGDVESDFDDESSNIAADIYRATTVSISKHLGTDSAIMNPARVLRVPGFMWRKSVEGLKPFLTQVVAHNPSIIYSAKEIVEAFPLDDECMSLAKSSRSTRRQHSDPTNITYNRVSAGTWYVVHTGNSEVLEVHAFNEGHQLHAACTIGNDPKGHDIVIRPGNWMYCNACMCGGFATQDRDDLYSVKREKNWGNIKAADMYEELTSDEIQQITEWLAYKCDNRTAEQWFNSRNNIIDEAEPDEYTPYDDAAHSYSDIPQKDKSAASEIPEQSEDDSYYNCDIYSGYDDNNNEVDTAIIVPNIIISDYADDFLNEKYSSNHKLSKSTMPNAITKYVNNIEKQKAQSFELIAPGVLVVMSGAIGTKHVIQLDKSWRQPPILWMVALARTGMLKTTIFDCVWAIANNMLEAMALRNALNDKLYIQAMAKFQKNPELDPPAKPRNRELRIEDVTYQWLATLLANNPCGVLASSDEILGFLTTSKGNGEDHGARGFMLKSYDGGRCSLNRKTDGSTSVAHNHVGVFGFTQTETYVQQFYDDMSRNVTDGFLPRILISNPPRPKTFKQDIETDSAALNKLTGIYEDLINEPANYTDCSKVKVSPSIHKLTTDAEKYWAAREKEWTQKLHRYFFDEKHWFEPWWCKVQGQIGRLALVIHMIRHRAGEAGFDVDTQSFEMAHELGHYFLGNAYRLGLKTQRGDIDDSTEYSKELMRIKRWTRKHKAPIPVRIMIRNKIFGNSKDANIAIDYWIKNSLGSRIEAIVAKKATLTFIPF